MFEDVAGGALLKVVFFIVVTVFLTFGDSAKDFFDKLFRSEFGQQGGSGKFNLVRLHG